MVRKSNKNRRRKQKQVKMYKHMTNQSIAVHKACLERNIPDDVSGLLDSYCDHFCHYKMSLLNKTILTIVESGYMDWRNKRYAQGLRDSEYQMKQSIWTYFPQRDCYLTDLFQWSAFLGAFKQAEKDIHAFLQLKAEVFPSKFD